MGGARPRVVMQDEEFWSRRRMFGDDDLTASGSGWQAAVVLLIEAQRWVAALGLQVNTCTRYLEGPSGAPAGRGAQPAVDLDGPCTRYMHAAEGTRPAGARADSNSKLHQLATRTVCATRRRRQTLTGRVTGSGYSLNGSTEANQGCLPTNLAACWRVLRRALRRVLRRPAARDY